MPNMYHLEVLFAEASMECLVTAHSRTPNGCLQSIHSLSGCKEHEEVLKIREEIMEYSKY